VDTKTLDYMENKTKKYRSLEIAKGTTEKAIKNLTEHGLSCFNTGGTSYAFNGESSKIRDSIVIILKESLVKIEGKMEEI